MSDRVFVAMSGGVDSSVAAALLAERGEDVVGVWMRLTPSSSAVSDAPRCCGTDEAGEEARRAAAHLGIPFYALDYAEVFGREVVDRFVNAYAAGETPNPCVACNGYVKFEALLSDVVKKFGGSRLATGHYARVTHGGGRHRLLRARDSSKDQSYALYMLGQQDLARLELPIGELAAKSEARALATAFGLPNAAKAESMDICFVDGDYRDLVRDRAPEAFTAGPIERLDGTVIGTHAGIGGLTVGQRSGVGVAAGERLYVIRLELDRDAAVVGTRAEIASRTYRLRDVRFTSGGPPAVTFTAEAVLRYRGTPLASAVRMSMDSGTAVLELAEPALVAPGQAAVLYDGDEVIGGGVVDRPIAA